MARKTAAQKAGEEAERLHAEAYGGEPAAENQLQEEPTLEVVSTKPQPDDKEPSVTTIEDAPPVEEAAAEPAIPAEPPAEEVVAPVEEDPKWEARYRALQGKYNAEVPRLNEEIKNQGEKISQLENLIANMGSAANKEAVVAPTSMVSDEDRQDFGEEMTDFVLRAARSVVSPEMQKLRKENEELRKQVSGVTTATAQSARDRLLSDLAQAVPDWETINKADPFHQWLGEIDAFSGEFRQDMLLRAFEKNDAPRVINFFKAYLQENAAVTASEVPSRPTPTVNMDTLVAPGAPGESVDNRAPEGSSKRIWTQADIAKFYRDATAGKYDGKDAEKLALEQDIIDAGNEGRIQG